MSGAGTTALVRPAEARDFIAIAALTNQYIRHTTVHFGTEDVTAAELAAQWQATAQLHPWLVAEVEGAFAGFAKAGTWRQRAAYRWSVETAVYVEPERQRAGVGTVVYRRLLDLLRRQGFRSAIGGITLPNPGSVRLHEQLGFRHVGTVRQAGCKFDRWLDVGFWQCLLRDDAVPGGELRSPAQAWTDG